MKAVVVDDEPLARERLRALLAEVADVDVVGEAGDGVAALGTIESTRADLVLLDIRMPGMDGLEVARHLASFETAPAIIFCTAYDDHALAAFDANAVDYLLKPVRAERLRNAVARARRFSRDALRTLDDATPAEAPRQRSHLCARVRGNLVLVPVAEIDYLLAEDKYVNVHYAGNDVLIEEPLKTIETEFGERFVRIHRNCLVALDRLAGLSRTTDGRVFAKLERVSEPLEVSRRNLPGLRKLVRSL
ncbi:LytR/AlgR family response regulator transcription factor [Dokdonella sp. MW10]|uniref:LytR/AlgR family response regulator transcription factor n=1 Tax=Dokdonella sp. MW10 TaxID=2992926 RepID=UPI003F7F7A47